VFAVLLEFGPEGLGRRLFSFRGMPRDLRISDFRPYLLYRGVPARAGTQWFFTEGNRPFTFYAVLGSEVLRHELVPRVNELLSNITISPRWAPAD
jgi:hypothetical protein